MKNKMSFGIVNLLAMAFGFGSNYGLASEAAAPIRFSGNYYGARTHVKVRGRKKKVRHGRSDKCKNQPKCYYQQVVEDPRYMTPRQRLKATFIEASKKQEA